MTETQYSRCCKCGNRRPKTQVIHYKLMSYCKDNHAKDKPSCYMSEFLKDLELRQHLEKELNGNKQ